jgi:hypothetical protein
MLAGNNEKEGRPFKQKLYRWISDSLVAAHRNHSRILGCTAA